MITARPHVQAALDCPEVYLEPTTAETVIVCVRYGAVSRGILEIRKDGVFRIARQGADIGIALDDQGRVALVGEGEPPVSVLPSEDRIFQRRPNGFPSPFERVRKAMERGFGLGGHYRDTPVDNDVLAYLFRCHDRLAKIEFEKSSGISPEVVKPIAEWILSWHSAKKHDDAGTWGSSNGHTVTYGELYRLAEAYQASMRGEQRPKRTYLDSEREQRLRDESARADGAEAEVERLRAEVKERAEETQTLKDELVAACQVRRECDRLRAFRDAAKPLMDVAKTWRDYASVDPLRCIPLTEIDAAVEAFDAAKGGGGDLLSLDERFVAQTAMQLSMLVDAVAPLIEKERDRRGRCKANRNSHCYGGFPEGHPANLTERQIDAAIEAFDGVKGGAS